MSCKQKLFTSIKETTLKNNSSYWSIKQSEQNQNGNPKAQLTTNQHQNSIWTTWKAQIDTKIRSKSVAWSTLTKSASKALSSSSETAEASLSSALVAEAAASTWRLQYSMTLERIFPVTLGRGITLSAQSSSIMCLIVCDSTATVSSTSKTSPSELRKVIFLLPFSAADDDIVTELDIEFVRRRPRERKREIVRDDLGNMGLAIIERVVSGSKYCWADIAGSYFTIAQLNTLFIDYFTTNNLVGGLSSPK